MPVWTCPKCGEKVENFSWGDSPWKGHRCSSKNNNFELPDVRENHGNEPLPKKPKKGNLSDFF